MIKKAQKPKLKPIGAIAGIRGKALVRDYLTSVFDEIGFKKNNEMPLAYANYKGFIDDKELKISFGILRRTHFIGINRNVQEIRYRTFQGLRMQIEVELNKQTRFIIAKRVKKNWLLKIHKLIYSYKNYKIIDLNYLDMLVVSPDIIFSKAFIEDNQIKNILKELATDEVISWGVIISPQKMTIGFTLKNLDNFNKEKLQLRLSNIVKLTNLVNEKPIEKPLKLSKNEVLARDNPKALAWRYLIFILLFILLGTGLLIAFLFGLAKIIGMI